MTEIDGNDVPICGECKGPMLLHMTLPSRDGLPPVCGFKCETCGTSLVREEDDW
jgi:hypothetical protein